MDIAEIRKKAKAQGNNIKKDVIAEQDSAPKTSMACADESSLADSPVEALPVEELVPVDKSAESMLVDSGDVIDRIFAVSNELSLATEESYHDFLESQSGENDRVIRQYLAFCLGSEEYALDITRISEIIKVREFTDIPRAPEYLLGIISLRGVVVPVFDLRSRFNLGTSEILATSRIVVCRYEDVTVGLLVDSINQVVKLADDSIEPPPAVLSGLDRDLVSGVGRYQGRMLILLNVQSVLAVTLD